MPAIAYQKSTGNFYRGVARLSQDTGYIVTTQVYPYPYLFLDLYFGDGATTRAECQPDFVGGGGLAVDWQR
jgi:hypothetical protein